jgi:hypothetical protein
VDGFGVKRLQLILDFHELFDVARGAGVNHVAAGNLLDVPAGLASVVHGRADSHAAHEHLAGVLLFLKHAVGPLEQEQLRPANLGFAQIDPPGIGLCFQIPQGPVACGHVRDDGPPARKIHPVFPGLCKSVLDGFHTGHELGDRKRQGVVGGNPPGCQLLDHLISFAGAGDFHHDIGGDRGDIERLPQHPLGVKAVAGVNLPRQIAMRMVRFFPQREEKFRPELDHFLVGQPKNLFNIFLGVFPDEVLDKISPEPRGILDGAEAQGRVRGDPPEEGVLRAMGVKKPVQLFVPEFLFACRGLVENLLGPILVNHRG